MWFLEQMWTAALIIGGLAVAYWLFVIKPGREQDRKDAEEKRIQEQLSKSHGSAAFADYVDLISRPEAQGGYDSPGKSLVYLGVVPNKPGAKEEYRYLTWKTDQHILLVANAGAGKGRDVIIPNLLNYQGPVFVLDPKGENARAAGRAREAMGMVHYLDPFGVTGKPQSRFNPLRRITDENAATEASTLASALVIEQSSGRENESHWNQAAQQLLAALIAHAATHPAYRETADLPFVRRLLMRNLNAILREMTESEAAAGLVANTAGWVLGMDDKERSGIVSTAVVHTKFIDDPNMQRVLSSDPQGQIDFSRYPKGEIMSVFLSLPAPQFRTFNRWLRLIVTSALDELTRRQSHIARPVWFMLDELAALGRFEPVEQAIGLARGYGVQVWSIFQDFGQMRQLYGDRYSTFISNAGVKMFFGIEDNDGTEYVSKLLGTTTIYTRTTGTSTSANVESNTVNWGYAGRALMTPDEVRRQFHGNAMAVILPGIDPIWVWRIPYYGMRILDGRWDDPRQQQTPAA